MTIITLSATSNDHGYQASINFPGGVFLNSGETYPSIGEAIAAAATKLLDMPERLAALNPPSKFRRK